MAIFIYITIFLTILFLRYRKASGGAMVEKFDDDGNLIYEGQTKWESGRGTVDLGVALTQSTYFRILRPTPMLELLARLNIAEMFCPESTREGAGETKKDLVFISDHPHDFRDLVLSEDAYHALSEIVAIPGVERIYAFGKKIWVQMSDVSQGRYDKEFRPKILAGLQELGRALDGIAKKRKEEGRVSHLALRLLFFMAVHMMIFCFMLTAVMTVAFGDALLLDRGAFFLMSSVATVAVIVFWMALMALTLKRTMWLVVGLGDFLLIGLAGFLMAIPLMLYEANIKMQQGEAEYSQVRLLGKTCHIACMPGTGRQTHFFDMTDETVCRAEEERSAYLKQLQELEPNCRQNAEIRFYLVLAHEESGHQFSVPVAEDVHDAANENMSYAAPVYPGALRHPWISTARVRIESE